jgi:hypothetical protein
MNALGQSSWWLIEKYCDKKVFTIIGPIFDDTIYNEKTCLLREQGRDILIEAVDSHKISKSQLREDFIKTLKYEYVEYDILENIKCGTSA